MITIVDYGMGNVHSIANMLRFCGYPSIIGGTENALRDATHLILPGVGAFDAAMLALEAQGLIPVLQHKALEERIPVLGICLGMQLMTESSEEGRRDGLGWIRGRTLHFRGRVTNDVRVPHMGWNDVQVARDTALTQGLSAREPRYYFVHSYFVACQHEDDVLLEASYGRTFTAGFARGNLMGVQFHPEKSHTYGMHLLTNFALMPPC